jgi:hypothetical protein
VTSPTDAVERVLREAAEPLHWTVVQDRALRTGLIDPFETKDVRRAVQLALRQLLSDGVIDRAGTGVYVLAPPQGRPQGTQGR